jgi:hypothetical protein
MWHQRSRYNLSNMSTSSIIYLTNDTSIDLVNGQLIPVTTARLRPWYAMCCCIGTCICCEWDHCFNISCLTQCVCCCEFRYDFCNELRIPGGCTCKACYCGWCHLGCDRSATICKCIGQICCWDQRCALPCDYDVPCMINFLGFNCCYNYKQAVFCCATLRTIVDTN